MCHFKPIVITTIAFILNAGITSADVGDQLARLLPDDGAEWAYFGNSVGIDNKLAIIGAPGDLDNGAFSGAAYLFDVEQGIQITKLLAADGAADDWFGVSVAISGNIVIVGAYFDDDNGEDSGSAYLFDTNTGTQIAKLLPSDGGATQWFGYSVAISGNTAIVGAFQDNDNGEYSGSAYLFDTLTGLQIAKLLPDDGATGDFFGYSVAIDQDVAIIGAVGDDDKGSFSGSAYAFSVTTGQQILKIHADDAGASDAFGYSVGIDGNTAIVGAMTKDGTYRGSGAAYLFNSGTGQQTAKLLPADGLRNDWFGSSVAVSGDRAIVGAVFGGSNTESGAAYLFDIATGDEIISMVPEDGEFWDYFGRSVAISGPIAIGGAYGDEENGLYSGSAYLFQVDEISTCLELTVENLVGGEQALLTITGGAPGSKGITVVGFESGQTQIDGYAGYCATFGIDGLNQKSIVGGGPRTFDANGNIGFGLTIPSNLSGTLLYFQTAERDTCPDECVSNRFEGVVQ